MSLGAEIGPGAFGALSAQHGAANDEVLEKYKEIKLAMIEHIKAMETSGDHDLDVRRFDVIAQQGHQLSMVFHLNTPEEMIEQLDLMADFDGMEDMARSIHDMTR